MLAILDYNAGNQTSVYRALKSLQIPCTITADSTVLREATGIIFPGVGAAGQAMRELRSRGLDQTLCAATERGQAILGICLGCQILLEYSAENETQTLGLLPGQCYRFPDDLKQEDGTPATVPHMGWNSLAICQENVLLQGLDARAEFYFVHSYYVEPAPELVLATTVYGLQFCSVYGRDGLWGVQFHPEKSGRFGLTILQNFYQFCLRNH